MKAFKNITLQTKFVLVFAIISLAFIFFAVIAVFFAQIEIIIGAAALSLILIFAMLIILVRNVAEPVATLSQSAKSFTNGDFKDMIFYDSDDELGQLSKHLAHAADSLFKLREAKHKVEHKIRRRELGQKIPIDIFSGEFKEAAILTNGIITSFEDELEIMAAYMGKISGGELSANMGYGQKTPHIAAITTLTYSLNEIVIDMQNLIASAAAGDFKKRIDAEKHSGEWRKLAHNMNMLMESISLPIEQARNTIDAVANGKLNVKMTTDAKGEFLKLKVSINNATTSLEKCVKTITYAIENVNNNPEFLTELAEDFAPIKTAIIKLSDNEVKNKSGIALNSGAKMSFGQQRANLNNALLYDSDGLSKKFSGAPRVDDMEINSKDTPGYMKSDFGKY